METVLRLDRALYDWINGYVGAFPLLDAVTRLLVNEYLIPVALALGLLFLWFGGRPDVLSANGMERDRWQRAVLAASCAVGVANAVVKLWNVVAFRDRPFIGDPFPHLLFYMPIDSSFPSNAAALTFAMATGVWLWDRRASAGFWVLAGLFPLARLFAGVHYPLDVVGGAAVGVLSALLANRALEKAQPVVSQLVAAMRRLGLA